MNIIAIIPARMGSSRFPGKPLAKICGLPMIEHVYRRTAMAKSLADVYIATCDDEIKKYCEANNMKVIMTKDTHERASDRAAEAMLKVEKEPGKKIDIVVMVQGDEPMLVSEMIDLAVKPLIEDKSIMVSNLTGTLKTEEEHRDLNEVKVVVDSNGFALYFSRHPIPFNRDNFAAAPRLKQVCIIPFQRDFLLKFNELPQTPLEIAESVDMLRVMEHGFKVKMVMSPYETYSVDTTEDLRKVEMCLEKDPVCSHYSKADAK